MGQRYIRFLFSSTTGFGHSAFTAQDDSGALNKDPYNMQTMLENPYATKP